MCPVVVKMQSGMEKIQSGVLENRNLNLNPDKAKGGWIRRFVLMNSAAKRKRTVSFFTLHQEL